ncbi:hypothetical protein [Salibacter sp.]|uniref:hypothetical protein n=1 Tax=Salibacter sp. TaxID=2010995 RepID=UPI0028700B55|nr:hypothetical protein [Salibacter sp.]MDR9486759.1 hypothetical protein [Salibacter sp.]
MDSTSHNMMRKVETFGLIMSVLLLIYWGLAFLWPSLFEFTIADVIFEMLWVVMMLLIFLAPVLSATLWIWRKMNLKSISFYSLLINLITIIILIVETT